MAEVRVPRMRSRSAVRWVWIAAVAFVIGVGWALWRYPEEWVRGLPFVLAVVVGFAVLASGRVYVDAERGTVRRTRWLSPSRTVAVAEADSVGLVDNRNGGLLLGVRKDRRSIYVPVLLLGDYGVASQQPDFLRILAAMVEQHAPDPRDVPRMLLLEAAHTEGGGVPAQSPLADLVSNRIGRAAGAGGAGAAGGGLGRLLD